MFPARAGMNRLLAVRTQTAASVPRPRGDEPDGILEEDEGRELHDALMNWTGGGGADGEESTTASLPLDPVPRAVRIAGNIFVFTGTGVFGTRRMMQDATIRGGGTVERNITMETNFVVLGTYVTPAWVHQSFGRKIEKAMEYRDRKGTGVQIVHEVDWVQALGGRDRCSCTMSRRAPSSEGPQNPGRTRREDDSINAIARRDRALLPTRLDRAALAPDSLQESFLAARQ